jgi:adenosyl cobinamide kinase/adenosyl cobinamide phosphate guanylyltransferase
MEPVTLAAGAIAQLAFNEFIKSSAGEAAKKLTGEALAKANDLRKAIWAKFKGNARAETALAEVEKEGTPAALDKVTKYLDLEMDEDQTFASEVRQLAQQIVNIQNQTAETADRIYKQNAGRDIFNIGDAGQQNKFGGT